MKSLGVARPGRLTRSEERFVSCWRYFALAGSIHGGLFPVTWDVNVVRENRVGHSTREVIDSSDENWMELNFHAMRLQQFQIWGQICKSNIAEERRLKREFGQLWLLVVVRGPVLATHPRRGSS